MQIKTNYKVLIPILMIQAISIISFCILSDLGLISKVFVVILIGVAGGKIYSSICNYEGKLRHVKVKK